MPALEIGHFCRVRGGTGDRFLSPVTARLLARRSSRLSGGSFKGEALARPAESWPAPPGPPGSPRGSALVGLPRVLPNLDAIGESGTRASRADQGVRPTISAESQSKWHWARARRPASAGAPCSHRAMTDCPSGSIFPPAPHGRGRTRIVRVWRRSDRPSVPRRPWYGCAPRA